jgi:aspartokinase-like uncharacterized kinase
MSDIPSSGPIVVKVGGSLFDLPDLGPRLQTWLDSLPTRNVLLVPGGGPTADVVRDLDRWHALGEERAHWLALRALTLNAYFLAELLPNAAVVERLGDWRRDGPAIVDAHAFARLDEGLPACLPHSWAVTSDAVAARVAVVSRARELVLLKSADPPAGADWRAAARAGYVDDVFADVLGAVPARAVNFWSWQS